MSDIRDIQLCGLEILKAVVDICEKHGLTYYLSSGTLLGAIRHNGFIPWDDDVDVEMPAADYKRFLNIAKKELPDRFFLQTYYSDPGYNEMWAKVKLNGTTSMPHMCKNLRIHFGIGIDIFPLVGIWDNPGLHRLQKQIMAICRTLLSKDYTLATGCDDVESNHKLKMIYKMPRGLRISIVRLLEPIVLCDVKKAKRISMVETKIDYYMDSAFYQTVAQHKFEDRSFQIPGDYDHILKIFYGDYMTPPPVDQRNLHESMLGEIIYDCDRDYSYYQNI